MYNVVKKRRKSETYKSHNYRTGRTDGRLGDSLGFEVESGVSRNQLSGLRHLEYVVKSDLDKSVENEVDVLEIVKLTVERRSGKGDLPLKAIHICKLATDSALCLVRTVSDALTAVNASVGIYHGFAVFYSDGFSRTVLKAGSAAGAFALIKQDRVLIFVH